MKKTILILLSVVAVIAAVILGLYIYSDYSFSFIETYKKNFSDNIMNLKIQYEMRKEEKQVEEAKKPSEEQPEKTVEVPHKQPETDSVTINYTDLPQKFVPSAEPIALKTASNARFENYADGVLCVDESSIDMYNKIGEIEWSVPIQLSAPVLKVKGSYILLFEQNGKKILLYEGKKQLFQIETKEKILTGNLSSNGDCAVLTEKVYYKGAVIVYNKSGQEIYSRSFGKNSALSVAISDSRRLCVSLLATDEKVSSNVVFLDINKKNEDVKVNYDDSIIFDIDFVGNTLHAFADNQLFALNDSGKQLWKYEYPQKTLNRYCDDHNIRLMIFDTSNSAELCVVTTGGREKQKIKEDILPDFCDISEGLILYNGGRSLYLTKLNGTPLAKYVASRDMKNAYFIDSHNILVVYNSSIEFLRIEKE